MGREAWWATVRGVAESWAWLSERAHTSCGLQAACNQDAVTVCSAGRHVTGNSAQSQLFYMCDRLEQTLPTVLKGKALITAFCPTLCDSLDYSLPSSSVHGISQAKVLEWVAIPFSRGSF